MNGNLRWKQRLQNLNKAFSRLRHACAFQALESRNLFVHTYDDSSAEEAVSLIKGKFFSMLAPCVENLNMMAEKED